MLYFDEVDLDSIFSVIAEHFSSQEQIPNYKEDTRGIEELLGIFERVRMPHYPTLADKAAFIFIQINKGHFFSNGNKRLALVVAAGFLLINNRALALDRSTAKEILITLFPLCEHDLEDHDELSPEEYALYNLSIIVADSHKYLSNEEGFDVLKEKITTFFEDTSQDVSEA